MLSVGAAKRNWSLPAPPGQAVLTGAADQDIVAAKAVEHSRRAIADDDVAEAIAPAVHRLVAAEQQRLDIGGEGDGWAAGGEDGVAALIGTFDDHIARRDDVDVVAGAAQQPAGAEAAIQRVVAGAAGTASSATVRSSMPWPGEISASELPATRIMDPGML